MASVALRIRISWLLICLCSSRTLKAISLFTLVSDPEVTLNGWCCELFPVFTELSGIALRPASHAAKKCHSGTRVARKRVLGGRKSLSRVCKTMSTRPSLRPCPGVSAKESITRTWPRWHLMQCGSYLASRIDIFSAVLSSPIRSPSLFLLSYRYLALFACSSGLNPCKKRWMPLACLSIN